MSPTTIRFHTDGDAMSADIINLQARARLIREAREAREKRHADRMATIEADLISVEIAQFPGGIDDMDMS